MGKDGRWKKMKQFTLDKLNPFEQYRRPKTRHVKQSEVMDAIDKILPKAPKIRTGKPMFSKLYLKLKR